MTVQVKVTGDDPRVRARLGRTREPPSEASDERLTLDSWKWAPAGTEVVPRARRAPWAQEDAA
jgi:hypothetical protein